MTHKLLTLIALATVATTSVAQTMKVYRGHVITAFTTEQAAEAQFLNNGAVLSVGGAQYDTADIDSVVVDNTAFAAGTVQVAYASNNTWVTMSGDIAPKMTVAVKGDHVCAVADRTVDTEITYTLSGTSNNGSFYTDGHYKSTLVLNNVSLTCPDSAAICVDNGKRINVELVNGSVNTLVDGANGAQKACFFINGHAEFKGNGTLNLTGNTKHAYASDEYTLLKASTGTINVLASASDGLHIEQYLQMEGGTLNISGVKGDCIDVSCTKTVTDELNGRVIVNAGTIGMDVTAEDTKGLKSEGDMTLSGGTIKAEVTGDGTKGISAGGNLTIGTAGSKEPSITMNVAGTTYHKGMVDESKCRGIKVKGNYTLAGGTISMNVTGKKAKGISVDGTYTYTGGTTNVVPE